MSRAFFSAHSAESLLNSPEIVDGNRIYETPSPKKSNHIVLANIAMAASPLLSVAALTAAPTDF
jgi:hypothetical protein